MNETIAIPISKLDALKSDFRQLGTYFFSFFSGNAIVSLDLKDLLLEQIFADIYYKDCSGKTFNATNKREFNAKCHEVFEQFKKLQPGGAWIVYPEQLYAKEQRTVTLQVSRDRCTHKTIKDINNYICKYLGEPIQLNHLEANLEPSDTTTTISTIYPKYQYLRPLMSALKWSWRITPNHDGTLVLNILLFRGSNLHNISELKDTAWPSFEYPSVAIKVSSERLSFCTLLKKICSNQFFLFVVLPIILTIINLLFG